MASPAMPTVRYTVEQLHSLRESPLVRKPDGLPSIEQWMEYVTMIVSVHRDNAKRTPTEPPHKKMAGVANSSPAVATRRSQLKSLDLFLDIEDTR